jgi:hypothetical protein
MSSSCNAMIVGPITLGRVHHAVSELMEIIPRRKHSVWLQRGTSETFLSPGGAPDGRQGFQLQKAIGTPGRSDSHSTRGFCIAGAMLTPGYRTPSQFCFTSLTREVYRGQFGRFKLGVEISHVFLADGFPLRQQFAQFLPGRGHACCNLSGWRGIGTLQ